MWEIFQYESAKVKGKLDNINLATILRNLTSLVKNEVEWLGQQSRNFNSKSRRLEHSLEILQGPNDFWTYCFIFLKCE